jgi:hypothetical protein
MCEYLGLFILIELSEQLLEFLDELINLSLPSLMARQPMQ